MLDNIWWSDKACFKLNSTITKCNWAEENSRVIVEEVNLPGVAVWAAISSDAFSLKELSLQKITWICFKPFSPGYKIRTYFQDDGASLYFGYQVCQWLDENFPGK